ncbi:MAG TPA: histidine kinase [Saprospiraceae bacterium]|nr:histidine kinase [Saprospiraceae bacterium]
MPSKHSLFVNRSKVKFYLMWLFWILIGELSLSAQNGFTNWRKFTEEDGLGVKYAYSLAEDKLGFIWLGAGDGLYRYDGHEFKSFYNADDSAGNSINSLLLKVLYDANYNRLWLASMNDLKYFDLNDYTFHALNTEGLTSPLAPNEFKHLLKTGPHTLWLANGAQIFEYNIIENSWKEISRRIKFPADCSQAYFKCYSFDENHVLLMAANYLFVLNTHDFSLDHTIKKETGQSFQNAYYDATNETIYIAGNNSLITYSLKDKIKNSYSEDYTTEENTKLNYLILFTLPLDDRYLMVSSQNLIFDKIKKEFIVFEGRSNATGILTGNSLFKDSQGNIWYTSYQEFCGVWNVEERKLTHSGFIKNKYGIHVEPYRTYAFKDSVYFFSGSGISGIGKINPFSGDWKIIENPLNKTNFVNDIAITPDKRIITLSPDGLWAFNPDLEKFEDFSPLKLNKKYPVINGHSLQLFQDSLLIICTNSKLFIVNHFTKKIINIYGTDQLSKLDNYETLKIIGSTNDHVYFSSPSGMYRLDKNNTLKPFNLPPSSNNKKLCTTAFGMANDEAGNQWFTTLSDGIFKYNIKTEELINYNKFNSALRSNNADHIVKSASNKILLSAGTSVYTLDTQKDSIISIVNKFSEIKGGGYGFYEGYKNQFTVFNYYPYIVFKNQQFDQLFLSQNSKLALISLKINGFESVNVPIFHDTSLTVKYNQNELCFSFANIPLNTGENTQYRYKIKQTDEHWIVTDLNNFCIRRLNSGKYDLLVQGKANNGNWSESIFQISINIKPIFYKSWWFFTISLIAATLFLYYLYNKRIYSIMEEEQTKSNFKKQISQLEMKALRAQMNPHFIFNSLNSIQKFIFDKDEYAASQYLTKFSRLIRMILDQSDQNFTTLSSELDLINLYIEIESLRFDKSFVFNLNLDESLDMQTTIPSMIIQPHVENAIWHGLLHLPDDTEAIGYRKGVLNLSVAKVKSDEIEIIVEDNGVGRMKAAEFKSKQLLKKKSYGVDITAERIRLYNEMYGAEASIETKDLMNDVGNSIGTRVSIILKIKA